jgi:hypothetical protein
MGCGSHASPLLVDLTRNRGWRDHCPGAGAFSRRWVGWTLAGEAAGLPSLPLPARWPQLKTTAPAGSATG